MKTKIAVITKHFHTTGISSVILNYCLNLNKNLFDVTILAGPPINQTYVKQCRENGIKVIELPANDFYSKLYDNLKVQPYDVAHIHGSSSLIYPEAKVAKKCKIRNIIIHSHSTFNNHKLIHSMLKPGLNHIATNRIACNAAAGKWLFGKRQFALINNSVNLQLFKFDLATRQTIREQLEIRESDFVIGHVGRFNANKNQKFLIDLISNLSQSNRHIHLVLVGNGSDRKKLESYATASNHSSQIHFVDEKQNVFAYYNAFDVFAMPSFYEGMPVVAIEAQANGLPCLLSDGITEQAKFSAQTKFLSLDNVDTWCEQILHLFHHNHDAQRTKQSQINIQVLRKSGYDIQSSVNMLEKIYKGRVS